jgi:hypothetical protein
MAERSIAWLIGPQKPLPPAPPPRCRQRQPVTALRMAGLNLRRMINLALQPKAGGGWIIRDPA